MKKFLLVLLAIVFLFLSQEELFCQTASPRITLPFNSGWKFISIEDMNEGMTPYPFVDSYIDSAWQNISLPHTAHIEPLIVVKPWEGESWYRKTFHADNSWKGKKVFLNFEAVMQSAEVWLNGKHICSHTGGYLPFSADISALLRYEKPNLLVVLTDNRVNADVPPGKAISELDFCYYSGIYRNVTLTITGNIMITDPVITKSRLSGTTITFPQVSEKTSVISIQTQVTNTGQQSEQVSVEWELIDQQNKTAGRFKSTETIIRPDSSFVFSGKLTVENPDLWSPDNPALYSLKSRIFSAGKIVDEKSEKIGIRKFELSGNTFLLNGNPLKLSGTNRHQEYPYIGNALPDNAQYRDVVKIREAGFNIVRLSHYPQSPAFMDACDELGLLVIDCIPGWQFFGNQEFENHSYQDARELIRRDRNHACVALWELSINETSMPDYFMKIMTEIAAEESPDQKLLTCGWINKYYDVYIPARQHAQAPDYWKKYAESRPFFTAEYGDWEYYAQNAGFNQTGFSDLKSEERTSRQLRGYGEKRMLQQALNFQEAHNDNLKSANIGDANWLMFDYNRGYAPDIESSGIMDIFRLPKYAFYMFSSQRSPTFLSGKYNSGPVLKIASSWRADSDTLIKVYSNCDEIALYINGKPLEKKAVEADKNSDKMDHPPLVFKVKKTGIGVLSSVGIIAGQPVAWDTVAACSAPKEIHLSWDRSGKNLQTGDVIFVYAGITDEHQNPVPLADNQISFSVNGNAELIGANPIQAEAGIATILIKAGETPGNIEITAASPGLEAGILKLKIEE